MRGMARLREEYLVRRVDLLDAECYLNDSLFCRMRRMARSKEDYLMQYVDCMHAE